MTVEEIRALIMSDFTCELNEWARFEVEQERGRETEPGWFTEGGIPQALEGFEHLIAARVLLTLALKLAGQEDISKVAETVDALGKVAKEEYRKQNPMTFSIPYHLDGGRCSRLRALDPTVGKACKRKHTWREESTL